MSCRVCHQVIKNLNERIKCSVFCNDSFHQRCTSTPVKVLNAIAGDDQIFWACPRCSALLRQTSDSHSGGSPESDDQADVIIDSTSRTLLSKLRLQVGRMLPPAYVPVQAHSTSGQSGSGNLVGGSSVSALLGIETVPLPTAKCWLFMSGLAPNVSNQQMIALVSVAMGTTDVAVHRLTSSPRPRYLAFKVGVPVSLRSLALSPSTWPQGVLFREYDGSPLNRSSPVMPPSTDFTPRTPHSSQFSEGLLAGQRTNKAHGTADNRSQNVAISSGHSSSATQTDADDQLKKPSWRSTNTTKEPSCVRVEPTNRYKNSSSPQQASKIDDFFPYL